MSNHAAFIHVENLVKTFVDGTDEVEVLRGLSLSVAEGEVLAITGESGSGKSTLLHLLGGLDTPTSGDVHFDGADITSLTAARLDEFRSREVGFVFQFHHLMAEFSALENVAIGGMVAGMAAAPAQAKARELLVRVGLEHRLTHRPPKLSGGERQRVALARALVNEPRVILADEPTGNLDRTTSDAVHDLIWDLRDRFGQTFVVVTHNASLAERSDRTVTLVDGRIDDNPDHV
jgi:lipoprotein-releasing system ATP-binding protein